MSKLSKRQPVGDIKVKEPEVVEFDDLESIDWEEEREADGVLEDEDLEDMVDPELDEPMAVDAQVPDRLDEQPQEDSQPKVKEPEKVAEGIVKTEVEQEGEMEVENHRMTQEELEMQEKTAEEIDEVIANIKVEEEDETEVEKRRMARVDIEIHLKEAEEVVAGIVKIKVEKEAIMKEWNERVNLMKCKKSSSEKNRLVVRGRRDEVESKTLLYTGALRYHLKAMRIRLCHLDRSCQHQDQVTTLVEELDTHAALIAYCTGFKSNCRIDGVWICPRKLRRREKELGKKLEEMRKWEDKRILDYYACDEPVDKSRIRTDLRDIHAVRYRAVILKVFESNITKKIDWYEEQAGVFKDLASKLRSEIADLDTQLAQAQIRVAELKELERIRRESQDAELNGGTKRRREEEIDELDDEDDEDEAEVEDEKMGEGSSTSMSNMEEVIRPRMSSNTGEGRRSGRRMSEEGEEETVADRIRRRGPRGSAVTEKSTPVIGKRQRWVIDCVEIVVKRSRRAL